jgi:hypothetical protein
LPAAVRDGRQQVEADGMTTYQVNEAEVKQARRLIDEGTVDTGTGWGEAAPAAAEGY